MPGPGYNIPTPPPHPEAGPAPEQEEGVDLALVEAIAQACHDANRSLRGFLGEDPGPYWADAPDWQRDSVIKGVHKALEGASHEQMHQSWLDEKEATGWTYGLVKDEEAKTHPQMVPYSDLPDEQKRKDRLFSTIVRHMIPVEPKPVHAAFLIVIDESGHSVGIINPHDISKFEPDHEADYGEVWRASTELAHDIDVMMHANATAQMSAQVLPGAIINGQMQIAAQMAEAEQNEQIRKQLLLDQKGGHRGPGGMPRGGQQ